MRIRAIRRADPCEVYDMEVCETHTFALANGAIVHNCDTKCYGKSCGVCDSDDLKLRRNYVQAAANEIDVDLSNVKVIDQKSQALKVRCRVTKSAEKRFVMNDHHRYAVRRAANRAGLPVTKRTVKFATDNMKYKEWSCGVDYMEFALTKKVTPAQVDTAITKMNTILAEGTQDGEDAPLRIVDHQVLPANYDTLRQDVDLSLFSMEIDVSTDAAMAALDRWDQSEYVKMVMREETRMNGLQMEEVNAKDYVDDLWLVRDGHRLFLHVLLRGKTNAYLVYAALFNKKSWIDAAKYPATRMDVFVETDANQIDFFRPVCNTCGMTIHTNLLNQPYHPEFCPKCLDKAQGKFIERMELV